MNVSSLTPHKNCYQILFIYTINIHLNMNVENCKSYLAVISSPMLGAPDSGAYGSGGGCVGGGGVICGAVAATGAVAAANRFVTT
jgi:hypothetical protein